MHQISANIAEIVLAFIFNGIAESMRDRTLQWIEGKLIASWKKGNDAQLHFQFS